MDVGVGKRKADDDDDVEEEEWVADPDFKDGPSWISHFGKEHKTVHDDRLGYSKKKKKKKKGKSNQNQGTEMKKDGHRGGHQKGQFGEPRAGFGQRGRMFANPVREFGGDCYQWTDFRSGFSGQYGYSGTQGFMANDCNNFPVDFGGGSYRKYGGHVRNNNQYGLYVPFSCNQHPFDQENCYMGDKSYYEFYEGGTSSCPPFVWIPSTGQLTPVTHNHNPDISVMSPLDRMQQFVSFIRSMKPEHSENESPIMVIENALIASKVGLKSRYEVELLMRFYGRAMFTGVLYIDDFFLARSVGLNKKQAKFDCYQKALDHLLRKPIQYLMSMNPTDSESVRSKLRTVYTDLSFETFPLEAKRALDSVTYAANSGKSKFAKKVGLFNLESGLTKLINFLKYTNQVTPNAVCRMTQAFTSSKCNLCHNYEEDMTRLKTGQVWFKGRMYIGDIIITGAGDFKKKQAKEKTYQRTVAVLLNKPLETILKGVSLLELDDDPPKCEVSSTEPAGEMDQEKSVRKLEKLSELLKTHTVKEELVSHMDMTCNTLQLLPTCLFRRDNNNNKNVTLVCELYLDSVFISSGQGEKRKNAQQAAYSNAYDILINKKPEETISGAKRLSKEELSLPDILEICVKGQSRWGESNITKLKRLGIEPSLTQFSVKDFVIMEHYDWTKDRKKNAFLILSQSATQNGMLLEWNISANENLFKCSMRLQGQDIGDACASAKQNARNLAAIDSLFRLYETQPVIRALPRNESQYWHTYESIKNQAEQLKQEFGSAEDGSDEWMECTERVPSPSKDLSDPETEEETDSVCEPISQWVKQIIKRLVTQYTETETLEDLSFGPGLPAGEQKEITLMCQQLGLKYITRQFKNLTYTSVFKNWSPQDMVSQLKKQGGSSGKYILLNKYDIPKHAEVRAFILNQEEISKQKIDAWKHFQTCQTMQGGSLNAKQVKTEVVNSFNTSTPNISHVQQQPFFSRKADSARSVNDSDHSPENLVGTPIAKTSPLKTSDSQFEYRYRTGGGELEVDNGRVPFSQSENLDGTFNQTPSSYHTAATSFQSMSVMYSAGNSAYVTPDSSMYGMNNLHMSF